jgi:hypothetical protein
MNEFEDNKKILETISTFSALQELSAHGEYMDEKIGPLKVYDNIKIYIENLDYKNLLHKQLYLCWQMLYLRLNDIWIANQIFSIYQKNEMSFKKIAGNCVAEPIFNKIISIVATINISTKSNNIKVEAKLITRCVKKVSNWIILRLNNSLMIDCIECKGKLLEYRYLDSCRNGFQIFFENTINYGEEVCINIKYSGTPFFRPPNFMNENTGLIWSEANILPITNFFPRDKYLLDVCYIYDKELDIVSCGELIKNDRKNRISFWKSCKPMLGLSFSYGYYYIKKLKVENIFCYFYKTKDSVIDFVELENRLKDIIGFYSRIMGEIPYNSLNICYDQNFSICCINSNILYLYRIDDIAISHELAHLWWGMSITGNGPGWRWIHEGFAEFFSELYLWYKNGKMEEEIKKLTLHNIHEKNDFEPSKLLEVSFGMNDEEYEKYKNYIKEIIGKIGWNNFLYNIKKIVLEFNFQSITVEELMNILEVKNEGL